MKEQIKKLNRLKLPKNKKIDALVLSALFVNLIYIADDIYDDIRVHQPLHHYFFETIAVSVTFYLIIKGLLEIKQLIVTQHELADQIGTLEDESQAWKKRTIELSEGITESISQTMDQWKLTDAEKEITYLLFKGLSLKSIAELRKTSEQTVKQQSSSIYKKSGLSNRSELLAYFLDEVMIPHVPLQEQPNITSNPPLN